MEHRDALFFGGQGVTSALEPGRALRLLSLESCDIIERVGDQRVTFAVARGGGLLSSQLIYIVGRRFRDCWLLCPQIMPNHSMLSGSWAPQQGNWLLLGASVGPRRFHINDTMFLITIMMLAMLATFFTSRWGCLSPLPLSQELVSHLQVQVLTTEPSRHRSLLATTHVKVEQRTTSALGICHLQSPPVPFWSHLSFFGIL